MKRLPIILGVVSIVLIGFSVYVFRDSGPTKAELTARAEKAENMSVLKTRAMNDLRAIRLAPSGNIAEMGRTGLIQTLTEMGGYVKHVKDFGTDNAEIDSWVCDAYYRDAQARLIDLRLLKADPDKARELERVMSSVGAVVQAGILPNPAPCKKLLVSFTHGAFYIQI